ncbi:Helicase conserved C-terminal domain-containing protein [Salinimicrobium catena]|uniref:Helicase conserved C-terminal domain-containing protein n=1 Tax=Salinimicrobium catena TaxID=390640 RepID=A0A1H5M486_9FLAO|nr:DEAD/DEAH box helicase [Salinimicrobium catena]SDL18250.1 Helicase conserved C-terminal domain-containing protein [Salinimicrobium catena]SEE84044.1 Helicase conserved C-terminal domain-containing protein [Salinimicrobium catena]
MTQDTFGIEEKTVDKELYDYQQQDIDKIFKILEAHPERYNLLYQLPTGGGKTVIFSQIVREYIQRTNKKVLILTHRIELCKQTSRMLTGFGVRNKIINSKIKELPDQDEYMCFVAMVETLNNRLNDEKVELDNLGMVIIDEAHYNSFRKLFKFFEKSFILGVTATPLSSNIKLPMKDNYRELIVGDSISSLIEKGFLAKANTYSYDVGLSTLKVGINGDYTVKSSEELYSNFSMQEKLLDAYMEKSLGKKTLIFNNGINTSKEVYETFRNAGFDVRHLDNTTSKQDRKDILKWFKKKPDAILTSVSILTTGFDEPTVESIILNRATKSLTLYYQMIGRGSRVLPGKNEFTVIDLGNNAARFGLWSAPVDWKQIFRSPDYFLENLVSDEEIEQNFKYEMPAELRKRFAKSDDVSFDVEAEYDDIISKGLKSKTVLERSLDQHTKMCVENSEDVFDARLLAKELAEDIAYRIRRYSYCISNSTKNYRDWLKEDYMRKLRLRINQAEF